MRIVDVVGSGYGEWDWSRLSFQLLDSILMSIKSIPFSILNSREEDRLSWSDSNLGEFDLKSAYVLATGCSTE